ncbi:hypothetical protein TTHERM_00312040 (macronuclear) [Tetrahymena thermophila SB210]|uniref:Transmembrane protein n=1 Tax=Tetrahymena thermophila (strain SB210) TaxID=312017 RepID=Q22KS5_TETTS|nr:hypothetical protein TTHERM_00312040 [Tetrahymena thermophila SB210]EAR85724.1 hypothetical protein TTHERM_00312040 [Tetrahymena thermophila SB210]|eukprot:XP_001033387.1 hypothetical protein TTHERM_00312040 [Tetrahymena thermophila SB210]
MKSLFLLGLLVTLVSCTGNVYINEKSIACISQIPFPQEAVNALLSTPNCNSFYTTLTTETSLLKKVNFITLSLCLAELKSVPDAAGLVIHTIVDKIHECTNIRLQSGSEHNLRG